MDRHVGINGARPHSKHKFQVASDIGERKRENDERICFADEFCFLMTTSEFSPLQPAREVKITLTQGMENGIQSNPIGPLDSHDYTGKF